MWEPLKGKRLLAHGDTASVGQELVDWARGKWRYNVESIQMYKGRMR